MDELGRIQQAMQVLQLNAADGLQIFEMSAVAELYHPPFNPDVAVFLFSSVDQCDSVALQRTLQNQYPSNMVLSIVAETKSVKQVTLGNLNEAEISVTDVLYIPAIGELTSFQSFQDVIAHLRNPDDGCPWDIKQTHKSLRPYLLEETYEVLDAIDQVQTDELVGELGDLMLQVLLHTQIAVDDDEFRMTDVMKHVNEKLIRRHPHVWGSVDVNGNPEQVAANWEVIKKQENVDKGQPQTSILDGIPKMSPALLLAQKYQHRAAKVGFDWHSVEGVEDKIREEFNEILDANSNEEKASEIGDLIFALVNWLRWLGADDPESVLRATCAKFYTRFTYIEERVRQMGDKPLQDYSLEELDAFWNEAKQRTSDHG